LRDETKLDEPVSVALVTERAKKSFGIIPELITNNAGKFSERGLSLKNKIKRGLIVRRTWEIEISTFTLIDMIKCTCLSVLIENVVYIAFILEILFDGSFVTSVKVDTEILSVEIWNEK